MSRTEVSANDKMTICSFETPIFNIRGKLYEEH